MTMLKSLCSTLNKEAHLSFLSGFLALNLSGGLLSILRNLCLMIIIPIYNGPCNYSFSTYTALLGNLLLLDGLHLKHDLNGF